MLSPNDGLFMRINFRTYVVKFFKVYWRKTSKASGLTMSSLSDVLLNTKKFTTILNRIFLMSNNKPIIWTE